ncbi:hypothetical protein ACP70R_028357 [Stipagrostis hirtigluma subsp. patula]
MGRLALSGSCPSSKATAGGGSGSAKSEPVTGLSECAADGSVSLLAYGKGSSSQCNDDSQACQTMKNSGPDLPEDILCHIHFLMPLRDAARAACVSRAFLYSWRHRPNITVSNAELGLDKNARQKDKQYYEIERDFTSTVDHILSKHSCVGLKVLKIEFGYLYDAKSYCFLNNWLKAFVTPLLEELTLLLPSNEPLYNFPCSVLSGWGGRSIKNLNLSSCVFSPIVGPIWLRNLKSMHLHQVRLTGDELGCLLSSSLALERLHLSHCNEIICFKIPCQLRQLSYLEVFQCNRLEAVEIKAPNISGFHFSGRHVELSLGKPLDEKEPEGTSCTVCDTSANLASLMPNLKTLTVSSTCQMFNTPMAPFKFLHLKHLSISLLGETLSYAYDYRSLVYFLAAAPSLETFILGASHLRMLEQLRMENGSVIGKDPPLVKKMPERHHRSLRSVMITSFCSSKSLVDLTCHILENAAALECLTLDTTCGFPRCSVNKFGRCFAIEKDGIMEAHKALMAIREYIEGKVPPTVKLNVIGPCSVCHALEL